MFTIKVAVSGGHDLIAVPQRTMSAVVRSVPADSGSDVAFLYCGDRKPSVVYDYTGKEAGLPKKPPHNGEKSVVLAYFDNEHGVAQALVAETEVYVVNDHGKTVGTYRP